MRDLKARLKMMSLEEISFFIRTILALVITKTALQVLLMINITPNHIDLRPH